MIIYGNSVGCITYKTFVAFSTCANPNVEEKNLCVEFFVFPVFTQSEDILLVIMQYGRENLWTPSELVKTSK